MYELCDYCWRLIHQHNFNIQLEVISNRPREVKCMNIQMTVIINTGLLYVGQTFMANTGCRTRQIASLQCHSCDIQIQEVLYNILYLNTYKSNAQQFKKCSHNLSWKSEGHRNNSRVRRYDQILDNTCTTVNLSSTSDISKTT